jgi:UDPglucose--hexose-1-phosphate uridylyltransferase
VAAFQNRFPALTQEAGPETVERSGPLRLASGNGRCEVVVFSPDHDAPFADLSPAQAGTGQSVTVQGTIEGYPYGTATAKVTLS